MMHSPTTFKKIPDDPLATAFNDSQLIEKEGAKAPLYQVQVTEELLEQQLIKDTNLYLSLMLSVGQQILIPSHQVIEIISIAPTQITPIPQVENPIMGIYSWRGEILWAVDGSALLGDTALCDRHFWSPRYSVVIVRESGEHIGIMVPEVGNLGKRSRFCSHADPAPLQPSPALTSEQISKAPDKIPKTIPKTIPETVPKAVITCPPIVDLVDRIAQLRHQLRST